MNKVLALGVGPRSQLLDCNGTNNQVANLQYTKDNSVPRFTVQRRSTGLRLDLSTATVSDQGIYTCMDTATGDSVSINITKCKSNCT